jgi:ribosomal-protein-alanine N-acetyltransferase
MAGGAAELVIRGPALTLRYPRASDAATLFELARDEAVTRYFSWGPYVEEAEAAAFIESLAGRRADGVALDFAISDERDRLIGVDCLIEVSKRDRRCDLGYWLGQASWGSGSSFESNALLAHLAFGPLRMERLGAVADVRNEYSHRALERVGFVREGVLRAYHRHYDERRDLVTYSILREEFERSEAAGVSVSISGTAPDAFVCAPRQRGREAREARGGGGASGT